MQIKSEYIRKTAFWLLMVIGNISFVWICNKSIDHSRKQENEAANKDSLEQAIFTINEQAEIKSIEDSNSAILINHRNMPKFSSDFKDLLVMNNYRILIGNYDLMDVIKNGDKYEIDVQKDELSFRVSTIPDLFNEFFELAEKEDKEVGRLDSLSELQRGHYLLLEVDSNFYSLHAGYSQGEKIPNLNKAKLLGVIQQKSDFQ